MPGFWVMVGVAALCGAIVGLERQLHGKPAGIRTSIMICLGTGVFIRIGMMVNQTGADPTRILSNVIVGVGFLGAGVMMAREGLVTGVTSAAVIWALAGIGFEQYWSGIALSVVTVLLLVGIEILERTILPLRKGDYAHDVRGWLTKGKSTPDD
jgi:putative Mg2+ transporter-C (MgtC) family protein